MSFLLFLLYYFICSFIFLVVGLVVYRFFIRKKCLDFSRIAEKQIDDYFKAYDIPDDFVTSDDKGVFIDVDNINR